MAPAGCSSVSLSSRFREMEDEQVAEFAKRGCVQATEYLLEKYKGFVESKARSYFLVGAECEDVVQEGMIGLYKAIRDFKADKLAHFRSFVELCVTRQIITAVKSASRNKHVFLNDYASLHGGVDDDDDRCLLDVISDARATDPERILIERCTLREISASVANDLSGLESHVFRGYLEGRTYQEMAAELGRSTKTVDNALQRAKRKIGLKLCEVN